MRVYRTAATKPIPPDARYSTREDGRYVTAVINGKKVTGRVTSNGTMSIESPYYSLKFKDNRDIVRYIRAYTSKRASEELAETITKLMEPGADTTLIESLPVQIRSKLVDFGIIDSKRSAYGRSLTEIISEYEAWLRTTRVNRHGLLRCKEYCDAAMAMIRRIAEVCKFYQWSDITQAELEKYLSGMNVKTKTYNNYLVAFKGFCKWAIENDFASKNPLVKSKCIGGEDAEKRRALTPPEFAHLLLTTRQAPTRFRLSGPERAVLYLLGAETGLRKSELLSLTAGSFNLDKGTVTVEREVAKNRHRAELPLKKQRVEQLREFLAGKFPGVKLFPVTNSLRAGDMIKKDLQDAGLSFETAEGVCVFHCLRHVYSTNLSKTNATWYEHKVMMRHSLKGDVTASYTDVTMERKQEIVEQLPDFEWPIQAQESMKAAG